MSKSALATITAQYTDSENEEDHGHESGESELSQASQVIIPPRATPSQTPEKHKSPSSAKKKKRAKKVRRLVSYQDDTVISDEDEDLDKSTESSDETTTEEETDEANNSSANEKYSNYRNGEGETIDEDNEAHENGKETYSPTKIEKSSKYAHYSFSLPPVPKGKPSHELVEKIRNLYDKMGSNNMDMNRIIQERKEFRNPSIYEKLIQFCDINEMGTNYPPEIYDPLKWGAESYYEELARVQKNEMLKRQKDRKETDKIEQATALARKVEEEAKKRKSKWDQPASSKSAVQQPLTTTVTGTKGTVISAFGNLPKKPAG